jgi:hypothetical protein
MSAGVARPYGRPIPSMETERPRPAGTELWTYALRGPRREHHPTQMHSSRQVPNDWPYWPTRRILSLGLLPRLHTDSDPVAFEGIFSLRHCTLKAGQQLEKFFGANESAQFGVVVTHDFRPPRLRLSAQHRVAMLSERLVWRYRCRCWS